MRRYLTALLFAAAVAGVPAADALTTRGEIYPGVRVGNLELGGKNEMEARSILDSTFQKFEATPLTFLHGAQQATIPAGEIVSFDSETTLKRAWAVGRQGDFLTKIRSRLKTRISRETVEPVIRTDSLQMREILAAKLGPILEREPQDAKLSLTLKEESAQIKVTPEAAGVELDLEKIAFSVISEVSNLQDSSIVMVTREIPPAVRASDLEPLVPEARTLINRDPLTVKGAGTSWKLTNANFSGWIIVRKDAERNTLDLDKGKITDWLNELAQDIERPAQDAVFELTEDKKKVKKFQVGRTGIELPLTENAAVVRDAILEGKTEIELLLREIPPRISSAHASELYGIRELIGRATTNFKGSPPNRIKNIRRGAIILNGTLIPPDQEFSLLESLRPFTTENGYLPELVIKAAEGKTVPEIGGGLCQIGTTMFRTVLSVGLPVTARRNHSYRVPYYEPPVGMDATIYDPAPDFKFVNDTGSWLMLLAYMESNEITFELWGSKDGRTVKISEPEITNLRKPPEKKIIETTELPVGKVKCTEKPHVGSDARFNYTVTYADGKVEEREFKSRYRPWQEVCLVGVAPAVAETPVAVEPPSASDPAELPLAELPAETLPSADTLGVLGGIIWE